jgi:hypothetical protein
LIRLYSAFSANTTGRSIITDGPYLLSVKQTTRDHIWNSALKRTHRDGDVLTAPNLADRFDCSTRTARDVLHTMAEFGFLEAKKTEYATEFHADDEAFSDDYVPE